MTRLLFLLPLLPLLAVAGPRDQAWEAIDQALADDLPQTALQKLAPLSKAALAEKAWGEAAKAIALRHRLEGEIEGGLAAMIRGLDGERTGLPSQVQPLLSTLSAKWLFRYYQENRWRILDRSPTAEPPGDDFETWDLVTMLGEIDQRFQEALSQPLPLQQTPIAEIAALLTESSLSDRFRPTVFDFLAHEAIDFYLLGEQASTSPPHPWEVAADSPALGDLESFLNWQPEQVAENDRQLQTLRLYQSLARFHREQDQPDALLLLDLERLAWADRASPEDTQVAYQAALRRFLKAHPKHELSALAAERLGRLLWSAGQAVEAHRLATDSALQFPDSIFGQLCQGLVREIEAPAFRLETERTWTPAGAEIELRTRNLERAYLRAYSRRWEPHLDAHPDEKALSEILETEPSQAWDLPLTDTGKYRPATTTPEAPHLEPGFYLLVASSQPDFEPGDPFLQACPIWVTDLALVVRGDSEGKLNGFVKDALSGRPLAQAQVTRHLEGQPWLGRKTVRTDPSGFFEFPSQEGDRSYELLASFGGSRVAVAGWKGHSFQEPSAKPDDRLLLFTDRALYRPGQSIHVKGIRYHADSRKNKYTTVADHRFTLLFRDPQGQVLAETPVTTNGYGSFSTTLTAPSGSLLGRCRLSAPGARGSTSLNVEEYKRPQFFAKLEPPEASVQLGDTVTVLGKAEAYTGAAIDGARVSWRVVRRPHFPDWIRWCWWVQPPSAGDQEIALGTAETAPDGSFAIRFPALPEPGIDPKTEPVFHFEISAEVTDRTGETRSARQTIRLAYTAAQVSLSSEPWLTVDRPIVLQVRTLSHDGEPRDLEGELTVHRLQEPEKVLRPALLSRAGQSTDPDTWPLGEVVATQSLASQAGQTQATLAPLPAGLYRAVWTSQDGQGQALTALYGFQVVDEQASSYPARQPFVVESPSWQVQPGETFRFLWGSGYESAHASVELFHRGQRIARYQTDPQKTQQVFTFAVQEKHRGGFQLVVSQISENRLHESAHHIAVPWSHQQLRLRWEHFTDKLRPGAEESWTAVIETPEGQALDAEFVATLYDASLDAYLPHHFPASFSGFYHDRGSLSYRAASIRPASQRSYSRVTWEGLAPAFPPFRSFHEKLGALSFFGPFFGREERAFSAGGGVLELAGDSDPFASPAPSSESDGALAGRLAEESPSPRPALDQVTLRENLNETAFFFPHLTSDPETGQVRLHFTLPEALTTWRFLGFAHDTRLRAGHLEGQAITAKKLMVQPNPPRFLRVGDTLHFTTKVSNQSEAEQTGVARLTLAEARTEKDRSAELISGDLEQPFTIPAQQSATLSWKITVPEGTPFLTYQAVASTGDLSDGEKGWLPVLSKKILVTESLALPIRGQGSQEFAFPKLLASGASETLRSQRLEVEAVSHPAWYAIMALPYLMEFPHECAEQTFNRYYANALAKHIANSDPKIAKIFEQWRGTEALDSPLEKNEEIKQIALEETPWVRQATNESEARRQVGLYFEPNTVEHELEKALRKLTEMQRPDGLWPWFPGGRGSEYISLYLSTGFARLRALGIETDLTPALQALPAIDADFRQRWADILEDDTLDQNHYSPHIAHYLYTRTFFLKDKVISANNQPAFDYFVSQAEQYWTSTRSRFSRAQTALALHRLGQSETAQLITQSLKENAIIDEERGMYWKDREGEGWWWWQAPIETQAMMIEAFREIDGDDKAVENCQVWLLKQKQTQAWKTTKATSDALYALLQGVGASRPQWLTSDALLEIQLGQKTIEPETSEAGTGFYEKTFSKAEIDPSMGDITLTKNDEGVSWASVHWQYLDDLDQITAHNETPLRLTKTLFTRENTPSGPVLRQVAGPVEIGQELVVRLTLETDRAMEFLQLKDHRGSGTEPVDVLSGYRWQDDLGYYQVTRDTATHFFIDRLLPGKYVFEYSVRIQHAGEYPMGLAEIRSMYAPEFNAHSENVDLIVR
ncbi:MAG: alpha-2-macroglobulin family protein [Verrucomicrobiota bacterium]